MYIVKKKSELKILEAYGYKPNKRIQYIKTYVDKSSYFYNVKKQIKSLFDVLLLFLSSPFLIIFQLYIFLKSLMWWCLVITKKNLIDDITRRNINLDNAFKKDVEIHFDNPEDIY